MSEPEIEQFIIVFKSFMDHASVEELNYLQREAKREYNKRLNGAYDNIKELPPSYFDSEEFKHPVGEDEPPYEDWTQPWD